MRDWSKSWTDIVHDAHWRAAITRRRYKVWFDPANGWWNLRETTDRLDKERPA